MPTLAFRSKACGDDMYMYGFGNVLFALQSPRKRWTIAHGNNNSSTRQRIRNACKCDNIFLPPNLKWNVLFRFGLILVFLDSIWFSHIRLERKFRQRFQMNRSIRILSVKTQAQNTHKMEFGYLQLCVQRKYIESKIDFKFIRKSKRFTLRSKILNVLFYCNQNQANVCLKTCRNGI